MSEHMDAVKNWGDIAAKLQRENFELRQALEASRSETREARGRARLDATATEQQYLSLKEIHDASGRAYDNTIADRDRWRLRAETAEGLLRDFEEVTGLLLVDKFAPHLWQRVSVVRGKLRAFLAGRGGSPTARPAPASYKEAPPPAVTGGDFVPGVDGGPPTATPIVPIGGGGSKEDSYFPRRPPRLPRLLMPQKSDTPVLPPQFSETCDSAPLPGFSTPVLRFLRRIGFSPQRFCVLTRRMRLALGVHNQES